MVTDDTSKRPEQREATPRLFSSPALGCGAFVVGAISATLTFASYFNGSAPIRAGAVVMGIVGCVASLVYLAGFRKALMGHDAVGSRIVDKRQPLEIRITAWAVLAASTGLAADIVTFMFAFLL